MPSRWSSSCWNRRASSSSASNDTSLPSRSTPTRWISFGRTMSKDRPGHREASLVVDPLAPRLLDDRVDQRPWPVADVVHEEPLLHADLRRGEPEAGCVVHRREHVFGEASEAAVDLGDLGGALLEHWVAEHPDRVRSHVPRLTAAASRSHAKRVDVDAHASRGTRRRARARRRAPRTTRPERATCPSQGRARRCRAARPASRRTRPPRGRRSRPSPSQAGSRDHVDVEPPHRSRVRDRRAARRRAPRGSARGSGRAHESQGAVLRPASQRAPAGRTPPPRRDIGAPAAPDRSRGRPPHRPRSPGGARLRCRRARARQRGRHRRP